MAKCEHCGHDGAALQVELDAAKKKASEAEASLEQAQARAVELEGQLSEAQQAGADLQRQLEELQTAQRGWDAEREALRAGITDDEGIEVAKLFWERLPEDQRPEGGMAAWLADRDNLPRAVQAYQPAPAAPEAAPAATEAPAAEAATAESPAAEAPAQGAQAPQPAAGLPRGNAGVVHAGARPGPAGYTREQIAAMSPEEYRQARDKILAAYR